MLFCDLPKAGSTASKNMRVNVTRDLDSGEKVHHQDSTYSRSKVQTRLTTYFKFRVARHPLVKLPSGYRNKMEMPKAMIEHNVGRNYSAAIFLRKPVENR